MESGEFRIEIGESSRDIRQSAIVTVEGTTVIPLVIDKNTPIAKLFGHPKGASFIQQMMSRSSHNQSSDKAPASAMGEGSEALMKSMMEETPLGSLVSYGRMTSAQLDALITSLNS